MTWDLNNLRKIAGLQESFELKQALHESFDDDDGEEDEDVKHADDEAKRRHIKLPKVEGKVDPDKDLHDLAVAKKHASEVKHSKSAPTGDVAQLAAQQLKSREEKKPEPKPPVEKKAPVEKKEGETEAEKKKRGKAPNPNSKSGQLRAFIERHMAANEDPKTVRKAAWTWASTVCDPPFTPAGFSTIYQGIKSKNAKKSETNECWILRHPTIPSFILKENTAMNMYQWISDSDVMDEPLVFETKEEATKVAKYLISFKNQLSDIERVSLDF